MASRHLEVERKYDPGTDTELPDLSGLPDVASMAGPERHDLEAAYYDTASLGLAGGRGSRCGGAPEETTRGGT